MTTQPREANLLDVLSKPTQFFTALKEKKPANGRFVWLVLLTGLVSGLMGYLMQRPIQEAMGQVPGMPTGTAMIAIFSVMGAAIATLLLWLVIWGLGLLGAGGQGRIPEVAAATFLPSLMVSLILMPIIALMPLQLDIAPANWSSLEGQELAKAMQKRQLEISQLAGKQPLSIISNVLSYGAMAWQFYLIFIGLRVMTGDQQKALKGTLIPALTLLVIGGALWLMGRAAMGLVS